MPWSDSPVLFALLLEIDDVLLLDPGRRKEGRVLHGAVLDADADIERVRQAVTLLWGLRDLLQILDMIRDAKLRERVEDGETRRDRS